MARMRLGVAALLVWLSVAPLAPRAQQAADASGAVVIQADIIHRDSESGVVGARGRVIVAHEGRVLQADTVTYDRGADRVTASGNVVIVEPGGDKTFADHAELSGDLRRGVADGVAMRFADGGRIAANGARRREGPVTTLARAVYSPCDLCPERPEAPPIWQIAADRVVHDRRFRQIYYYDAWLQLYGLPVAYTPFLISPDATAKRQTGFLTPIYGSSTVLGDTLRLPFFINLAPHRDATLTALLTGDRGVVTIGQYRERMRRGAYELNGSLARREPGAGAAGRRGLGWHIDAGGLWSHDSVWQYGLDVFRASDKSYLGRYEFDHSNPLTSRAFVEGVGERSHASVSGYVYQGLRAGDDARSTPVVAPLLSVGLATEPDQDGTVYSIEASGVAIERELGTDSRRVTLTGGWKQPFVTGGGHLVTLQAVLRGDGYNVHGVEVPGEAAYSGTVGRLIPRAGIEWRYPLVRPSGGTQYLIEPLVLAAAGSVFGTDEGHAFHRIPDEDSRSFEFDEVNLFSLDRSPGHDRVESGIAVNYGLRLSLVDDGKQRGEALLGQSWRPRPGLSLGPGRGLDERFSHYVGRVRVSPWDFLDASFRFRLDNEDHVLRRSEVELAGGPSWLRMTASYVRLEDQPEDGVGEGKKREQILLTNRLRPGGGWTLNGSWQQDLQGRGTVRFGGSIAYEDECLLIKGDIKHRFVRGGSTNPDTTYLVTVILKTLS